MRRVVLIGSSGAGKSHLAVQLAQLLAVPHIELDALFWEAGWQKPDRDAFVARVRGATDGASWVLCGNYAPQRAVSWSRADTIVWLDLPLTTITMRLLRRSWNRWRRDEVLWGKNRQQLLPLFKLWNPDASLLAYAWMKHGERRQEYAAAMRDPRWAHARFVHLRSAREVERFLREVARTAG